VKDKITKNEKEIKVNTWILRLHNFYLAKEKTDFIKQKKNGQQVES
jgi:hypothetical protein